MKVKTYGQDWEFEPNRMMEVENGPYVLTFDYNILSTKYEALEAKLAALVEAAENLVTLCANNIGVGSDDFGRVWKAIAAAKVKP